MSDERLDELLSQPQTADPAPPRNKRSHPKGWEPGIDTERGEVVASVDESEHEDGGPDWSHVISALGFDPDKWVVIDDSVQVRSWDVPGHGRQFYYRANLAPTDETSDLDVEALAKKVRKRGPLKAATDRVQVEQGGWLVVVLADWQAGKGTDGGANQLAERVARLGAMVEQRLGYLRDAGVDVRGLAILCAGDLVEACDGHYEMQRFEVELDMRQQTKLVRRLLLELIDRWAPRFDRVVVAAAAGNHGEKRVDGKAVTSWSDNLDIEIPEQVAELCEMKPERFGHVGFLLPEPDQLTVTVDLDGLTVGVAHGHQMTKGGAIVQRRALKWWRRMAFSSHPVGDVDVLVSGHYHHFETYMDGRHDGSSRTWMQAPALDGGSPWWEHTGGGATHAGTLTFVASHGTWSHLEVLPADGYPE